MAHVKPEDIPNGGDRCPAIGREGFRTAQWGNMEVGLAKVHAMLRALEKVTTPEPATPQS